MSSPRHSVTGESPAHLYQHLQQLQLQNSVQAVRQAAAVFSSAAPPVPPTARRHSPPGYSPLVHDSQMRNSPPPKTQNLCIISEDSDAMEFAESHDAVPPPSVPRRRAAVTSLLTQPDVQITVTSVSDNEIGETSSSSSSSDEDEFCDDVDQDFQSPVVTSPTNTSVHEHYHAPASHANMAPTTFFAPVPDAVTQSHLEASALMHAAHASLLPSAPFAMQTYHQHSTNLAVAAAMLLNNHASTAHAPPLVLTSDDVMSVSLRRTLSDISRKLQVLLEDRKTELTYDHMSQLLYRLRHSSGELCLEMEICPEQRAQNSLRFRKLAGDNNMYAKLCGEVISYMQTCQ